MKTEPSEADLEVILDYLYNRSVAREKAELESLKGLFNAFRKVSFLAGKMPEEQEDGSNISQVNITKQMLLVDNNSTVPEYDRRTYALLCILGPGRE
jgi:hypothetical protein